MRAIALRVELRIPAARSLKTKRSVLRPLIEGLRRLGSFSVAEVDSHDVWQRSVIGVAVVAPDQAHMERLLGDIRRYLDGCIDVEILALKAAYLEDPEW